MTRRAANRPPRRAYMAGIGLAAIACSLPRISVKVSGPEFVLDATTRAVEFSVTACMNSPAVKIQRTYVQANFTVQHVGGAGAAHVRGVALTGTASKDKDIPVGKSDTVVVSLPDDGPWKGQAGLRCGEPQIVRLERTGDDPTERLEVTWAASFTAKIFDTDAIHDEDLSIRIEPRPLPTTPSMIPLGEPASRAPDGRGQ